MNSAKVLMSLLVAHPAPASIESLVLISGLDEVTLWKAIGAMLQDQEPYGALVKVSPDGFSIAGYIHATGSAGGWAYLEECRDNPQLQESLRTWKDEALTGIRNNGKMSAIKNAALPVVGDGGGYRDPEAAAHRANRRG
jgi:hypothetical protein